MNVHPRSVRLAASFVVAVLAGCAPVAPTTGPTPGLSDGTPAGGAPSELATTGAALPAGRYTYSAFEPRITIELDGTWEALNLLEGFFDLGHLTELDDDTLVQFALAEAMYAGPDSITPSPPSAAGAVATIESNPSLSVIETSGSRIGGLDGAQVTLQGAAASDWPVLMTPGTSVVVESDRRLWIAFFDTPGGLLAIIVSGRIDAWDQALAAAEPVLESVTIGGPE
jgi:hypothetical protein